MKIKLQQNFSLRKARVERKMCWNEGKYFLSFPLANARSDKSESNEKGADT